MFRLRTLSILQIFLLWSVTGCGSGSSSKVPDRSTPEQKESPQKKEGPRGIAVGAPIEFDPISVAKIKILLEDKTTSLEVDDKAIDLTDQVTKAGEYTFVTPEITMSKTRTFKIKGTVEPNNYTKIVRSREVTVKAGEETTVDLRKKDDKIPDNVIIRWVPTPKIVVKDMCELAKVGPNDVVMDPGCGDAIMIITAIEDFKAKRGKGTDLDPEKVKTSQERVEKAGLKDKITIKEGNALKLTAEDLKDVTVMMLYMGDDLNERLRPLLWEYLPVGARVVSHRFLMGDWAPDKSIKVTREGDYGVEDFDLHVWTITGKEKKGEYKKEK